MMCVPWTIETLAAHTEAMRIADEKFQTERDKRYSEGNELRAMALKIKETADATALGLERESQTYKEARNDAMRERNLKETGIYATRDDLSDVLEKSQKALVIIVDDIRKELKPIFDHVAADSGASISTGKLYAGITVVAIIMGVIFTFINKFL